MVAVTSADDTDAPTDAATVLTMGLTQHFFAARIPEFEHVAAGFSGNQGCRGGFSFRTYSMFGDECMLDKYY